jgi:hypothetical protein
MEIFLSSLRESKNIIQLLRYIFLVLIFLLGFITIVATGGGGGGGSGEADDNSDGDTTNKCGINYDANPGCNDSDESCVMAMRINLDRKTYPDESDCAPAIKWSEELAAIAQAHSQNMCQQRKLAHELDGKDPFDRMADAGIDFVTAGENVAMGTEKFYDLNDLEDLFMNEPECEANHRGNILNRNFTHLGIGVAHCDDGSLYVTQDFASFSYDDIRDDPHEYCKY